MTKPNHPAHARQRDDKFLIEEGLATTTREKMITHQAPPKNLPARSQDKPVAQENASGTTNEKQQPKSSYAAITKLFSSSKKPQVNPAEREVKSASANVRSSAGPVQSVSDEVRSNRTIVGDKHDPDIVANNLQATNNEIIRQFQNMSQDSKFASTLLKTIKPLRQENETHRHEIARLRGELDHSMQKTGNLEKDLAECKEQILRMQPFKQASELQISETYTSLCSAIEGWAEKHFGDIEDLAKTISVMNLSQDSKDIIAELLMSTGEMKLLEARPDTSIYMIMYMIMLHLFKEIVQSRRWVIGMADDEENLLEDVLSSMKRLEPPRDTNAIGLWRSETYRALVKIPRYAQMEESGLKACTKMMGDIFRSLAVRTTDDGIDSDGLHAITLRAAELASQIATSSNQYTLEYYFVAADPKDTRQLDLGTAHSYNLIDVKTGQPVSSAYEVTYGKDGKAGEVLAVVFPALEHRDRDGKVKVICKPTVLAKFCSSVMRKAKGRGLAQ